MEIDFYKLQAAGNDFILVNYSGKRFPSEAELRELGRRICRRDYGIGGNGLIAVRELSLDSISAVLIDPSGDFPAPSTDAALCFSRLIFDSGIAGKEDFTLKINGTAHTVGIIDSNNFRISMGKPMTADAEELREDPETDYIHRISAGGKDYPVNIINLQKTGIVTFTEAQPIQQIKSIADRILTAAEFDASNRLIFATVNSREDLDVRIRNSRGDDFASSCAIAAVAAVVNGFLDRNATVTHKQGEYYFQWLHPSNEVFMTGSSDYIFSGSMFIEL